MKGWCDYMKIEDIIAFLEQERMAELTCAMKSKELMKRTLNPFRRIAFKRSYNMFMAHSIGIEMTITKLKRQELKET